MSDFAFAGKTFELRLDNGIVFHNTYGAEGNTLHYEEVDGALEGGSEEAALQVGEIARGVYLLGWNELSGTAVAQVLDFNTGTVTGFWSIDDGGGRTGEMHTGTFREVE